jgi:hypothetical protein
MWRYSVIELKKRHKDRRSSDQVSDPDAFIARAGTTVPDQPPTTALMAIDQARRALEIASTLDDVKELRDRAEAMRIYAKQAKYSLEIQNRCAELKLRAERKAGVILSETTVKGGERHKSHDGTYERHSVLDELGISKMQSSRWQAIAAIPEDLFERHLAKAQESKAELTSAKVIRLATMLQKKHLDSPKKEMGSNSSDRKSMDLEQPDILDDEFQKAFQVMEQAINNAKASRWQITSKETVLKYLDLLFHTVTVDESDKDLTLEDTMRS